MDHVFRLPTLKFHNKGDDEEQTPSEGNSNRKKVTIEYRVKD